MVLLVGNRRSTVAALAAAPDEDVYVVAVAPVLLVVPADIETLLLPINSAMVAGR